MKSITLFVLLAVAGLLSVAAAVYERFPGDLFLARRLQQFSAGPWEESMGFASDVGAGTPMVLLGLALALWFFRQSQKAEGLATVGALVAMGAVPVLKFLIHRPRPPEDLILVWRDSGGLSFPSGHAFMAILLFGLICYLAPTLLPWRRAVHGLRTISLLLIILIGLSRIYLGAHWPSDVIGGFLFGGLVLMLVIRLYNGLKSPRSLKGAGETLPSHLPESIRTP